MGKEVSLNQALGQRESKLLSDMMNETIEISSIEFESGKDSDGKDFERAYLIATEGVFRSSNKAVLTKAHKIAENLPKGSTVKVTVVEKKGKKGGYKYIDIVTPTDDKA
jgi:hypothetical protein